MTLRSDPTKCDCGKCKVCRHRIANQKYYWRKKRGEKGKGRGNWGGDGGWENRHRY